MARICLDQHKLDPDQAYLVIGFHVSMDFASCIF